MLDSGNDRHGQWSLEQICRPIVYGQDPIVDGYPKWMPLFASFRHRLEASATGRIAVDRCGVDWVSPKR
ncbi:DUF1569 domain-containing protein [Roseimaritima multifibrata]|uniref:DUF1569 domain-containing protein n=1 Tax=Roseimaritima multifibrata TaxID=1930274 RepID=UPI0011A83CD8